MNHIEACDLHIPYGMSVNSSATYAAAMNMSNHSSKREFGLVIITVIIMAIVANGVYPQSYTASAND